MGITTENSRQFKPPYNGPRSPVGDRYGHYVIDPTFGKKKWVNTTLYGQKIFYIFFLEHIFKHTSIKDTDMGAGLML